MPIATTLSSEYVPARSRPFAVTLTIVCVPIGGTLAGFVAAGVLPELGWRALFVIGGVLLMTRFGSKGPMAGWAAAAAVLAVIIAAMSIGPATTRPVIAMLGFVGGTISAVQVALYALSTHIYPTALRATGVGTAVSVGRVGGILSSYLGAWALEGGGPPLFFALVAVTMPMTTASLLVIRRRAAAHYFRIVHETPATEVRTANRFHGAEHSVGWSRAPREPCNQLAGIMAR